MSDEILPIIARGESEFQKWIEWLRRQTDRKFECKDWMFTTPTKNTEGEIYRIFQKKIYDT